MGKRFGQHDIKNIAVHIIRYFLTTHKNIKYKQITYINKKKHH